MNKNLYLSLACICNTLFRYRPFYFEFGKKTENHSSYSVGQALSYVFLLLLIVKTIKLTKRQNIVFEAVFWCSVSNLLDELFFDPLHLGINECIFVVFIIIRTLYKIYKLNNTFLKNGRTPT